MSTRDTGLLEHRRSYRTVYFFAVLACGSVTPSRPTVGWRGGGARVHILPVTRRSYGFIKINKKNRIP